VPERLDWWFGEGPETVGFTIREAVVSDLSQIVSLLRLSGRRPKRSAVYEWIVQNEYCVRLISRNHRHAVGLCVSRHRPEGSRLIALVVPVSVSNVFPLAAVRLVMLAAAELPETELRAVVRLDDPTDPAATLRLLQFKQVRCDEVAGTAEWFNEPLVTRSSAQDGNGDQPPTG
jgi:hypothetical protein